MSSPRRDQMVAAFCDAGREGLTWKQLAQESVGGAHWRRHLQRMKDDGFVFCEHASRFGGRPWRWTLVSEPVLHGQSCPVPAQGALLELDVEPQCALLEGVVA